MSFVIRAHAGDVFARQSHQGEHKKQGGVGAGTAASAVAQTALLICRSCLVAGDAGDTCSFVAHRASEPLEATRSHAPGSSASGLAVCGGFDGVRPIWRATASCGHGPLHEAHCSSSCDNYVQIALELRLLLQSAEEGGICVAIVRDIATAALFVGRPSTPSPRRSKRWTRKSSAGHACERGVAIISKCGGSVCLAVFLRRVVIVSRCLTRATSTSRYHCDARVPCGGVACILHGEPISEATCI